MKKLYCISGLGADDRVFQFLALKDYELIFVKWEMPNPNESLSNYCQRLLPQITEKQDVILIGVSFGGIIAQEISKLIHVKKIILISSIKDPSEMDWKLRLIRSTKLYRIFPSRILKWLNLITADYYFGVENKQESSLLRQIILDTEDGFSQWAIKKIMTWKPVKSTAELFHLHGSRDRIFPIRSIKNFKEIRNAGHFMIVNRAEEISQILLKEFKS